MSTLRPELELLKFKTDIMRQKTIIALLVAVIGSVLLSRAIVFGSFFPSVLSSVLQAYIDRYGALPEDKVLGIAGLVLIGLQILSSFAFAEVCSINVNWALSFSALHRDARAVFEDRTNSEVGSLLNDFVLRGWHRFFYEINTLAPSDAVIRFRIFRLTAAIFVLHFPIFKLWAISA